MKEVLGKIREKNQSLGGKKRGLKGEEWEQNDEEVKRNRKASEKIKVMLGKAKKSQKKGKGIIFYREPIELLERLELLAASIKAGNDSIEVLNEFKEISHELYKLELIKSETLNEILEKYI